MSARSLRTTARSAPREASTSSTPSNRISAADTTANCCGTSSARRTAFARALASFDSPSSPAPSPSARTAAGTDESGVAFDTFASCSSSAVLLRCCASRASSTTPRITRASVLLLLLLVIFAGIPPALLVRGARHAECMRRGSAPKMPMADGANACAGSAERSARSPARRGIRGISLCQHLQAGCLLFISQSFCKLSNTAKIPSSASPLASPPV
mmetsp:Transcript_96878/g.141717  ORF Transcript_96878/g.141717 Transcript_96878/m.141717 type:complete len:214 (-) Transcript_96878:52-693(-)